MILSTPDNAVYQGSQGRVWEMQLHLMPDEPRKEVSGPCFLIWAPRVHPVWSYYMLASVSLSSHSGVPDAVIMMPGATHEIFLGALDPSVPEYQLDDRLPLLMPLNYAGQINVDGGSMLHAMMLGTAKDVADGKVNPEDVTKWIELFGDSNLKQEYKSGRA